MRPKKHESPHRQPKGCGNTYDLEAVCSHADTLGRAVYPLNPRQGSNCNSAEHRAGNDVSH
jgi:hypothetical protein